MMTCKQDSVIFTRRGNFLYAPNVAEMVTICDCHAMPELSHFGTPTPRGGGRGGVGSSPWGVNPAPIGRNADGRDCNAETR